MFSVGDRIIYGATGVCKITDITENALTGVVRKYYVLCPVDTDKSVIYVPVDNEKLTSRMRAVPSAKELKIMLEKVKGEQLQWVDNNLERSEQYHKILNDGDVERVVVLFRTLHAYLQKLADRGKHLPKADERLYKECSKLLCCEFSSILNLEQGEVLSVILDSVS